MSGYETHVDVDGDGTWDEHTVHEHADGSVAIVADMNGDGHRDFVGHDYDADGLVDAAEYDNDHDGHFETKMVDTNGDGWLDETVAVPEPSDDHHVDATAWDRDGDGRFDPLLVDRPGDDAFGGDPFARS